MTIQATKRLTREEAMRFSEQLNAYIDAIGCTARQLSNASGLSPAVISRYRSGERVPALRGPQLDMLAAGLAALADAAGRAGPDRQEAREALSAALARPAREDGALADNLSALIDALGVTAGEVARALNYDASYISRIRAGARRPSDSQAFADKLGAFLARRCESPERLAELARLTGVEGAALASDRACREAIKRFLLMPAPKRLSPAAGFLEKLDGFDLSEYIRSIRLDELPTPSLPPTPVRDRVYIGPEGRKAAELDFLTATASMDAGRDVFMCSDMPMEKLAADLAFDKKWMLGLGAVLKKGLQIRIIHDLDRPFHEMMLGLESWIPLYMTGQISPYALPGRQSGVYCHLTYVSGAAALHGECVRGHEEEGRCVLSGRQEELAYYRQRSLRLLEKARPVMEIYRRDTREAFEAFLSAEAGGDRPLRGISTAPSLGTLPAGMLEDILKRASVPANEAAQLRAFAEREKARFDALVSRMPVRDEIHLLDQAEFEAHPVLLPLAGSFCERDLPYTYAEYRAHFDSALARAEAEPNYRVEVSQKRAFRNLQIVICEGKWVLLCKQRSPVIHFVIRHPQLRRAIENMALPIVE